MSAVASTEHDICPTGALSRPLAHSSSATAWASGRAPRPARYEPCSAEHRHPSPPADPFTAQASAHDLSRSATPTSPDHGAARPSRSPLPGATASYDQAAPSAGETPPTSSRIGLPRQCHTSPATRHATRSRDPSDPALGAGSGRTHAVVLGALPGQCVIDQGTRDLIYWPAVLLSRLLASPDSMPTYGKATVARSPVASHPGPLPPARTHQATVPQHAHDLKRPQCHTSPRARPSVHVQCDNVRGAPALHARVR